MGQKKKAKRFDKKLKAQADVSLKAIYAQYDKMANPATSFKASACTNVAVLVL